MNKQYELKVTLTVKAPLISSGGGDVTRGINRIFYRNANDQITLQGSHIKGKLLEAMNELASVNALPDMDLTSLFGAGSEEHDEPDELRAEHFIPKRAALHFSDFLLSEGEKPLEDARLTRVSIDKKTGTSKESFLQTLEKLFKPGALVHWEGFITFFAGDRNKADTIADHLALGLKWITGLGGSKGTGYGRLSKVETTLEEWKQPEKSDVSPKAGTEFTLDFQFIDDLLIGGTTKKTNYIESEQVIPGATIKGSFARFLNRLCGVTPDTSAINKENKGVYAQFPALAEHFSNLHFSHAFPVAASRQERPVTLPFSMVQTSTAEGTEKYFDVALLEKPELDKKGKAPLFKIDWKDTDNSVGEIISKFGWTSCEIINKTRTAIDPKTRRARDEMLYTFQYLTPYVSGYSGKNGSVKKEHQVRWFANIRFPEIGSDLQKQMVSQFFEAVQQGWHTLGKRDSRFNLMLKTGRAKDRVARATEDYLKDDLAIVTLQTDALMFDGQPLADKPDNLDLFSVYQHYWNAATGGACELTRFFARQKLAGGYLAKRYPIYNNYYPFVLTEAGSVFVLKAKDNAGAKEALKRLSEQGLPLPPDILARLPQGKEPWESCPFVPENGYGEIKINLEWHWTRCLQPTK